MGRRVRLTNRLLRLVNLEGCQRDRSLVIPHVLLGTFVEESVLEKFSIGLGYAFLVSKRRYPEYPRFRFRVILPVNKLKRAFFLPHDTRCVHS